MPNSTPSFKAKLADKTNIINLNIVTKNVEVSQVLNNNLQGIIIQALNKAKLQLTFVSGESGSKFFTVKNFNTLTIDAVRFSGNTLYIQSDTDSTDIEILELYT